MLGFEFLIWDLLETQAVVPLVKDSFNQVLFEGFRCKLFPKAFHAFNRALRQVSLPFNAFESLKSNFFKLLRSQELVKADSFDNGDSFALSNIELKCFITIVFSQGVFSFWTQDAGSD